MFWISVGNSWCRKYRAEIFKDLIQTDPHGPSEFRINGPISNMPEFSQDFNCPTGSKMNPQQKCNIYDIEKKN